MIGTEPHVANGEDLTPEWYVWLKSHTDEQLKAQCNAWGKWCPNDNPELDTDLVMMKWECARDILSARAKGERDRRQADHVAALIKTADSALRNAIKEAQRHPMANTTLRFLELSYSALENATDSCAEEMEGKP